MDKHERKKWLNIAYNQSIQLKKLKVWLRNTISFSTILFVFSYWGLQGSSVRFYIGVISVIALVLTMIAAIIINLGVRNGKRNIEKILELSERS